MGRGQTTSGLQYTQSIEQWRADRLASLTADDGWLTLVGLYWLNPGANCAGSDPVCPVALAASSSPARLGVFEFGGGSTLFRPARGVNVRVNGQPASDRVLRPQPGDYDVVTYGSLTLFVIERGDRFGIRVRDTHSAARQGFAGLKWFAINPAYRLKARFVAHDKPTSIMIPNVLGDITPWPSPGYVVFVLNGREHRLQAVLESPDAHELFFVFRDLTTDIETYPGGRFLYAELPDRGEVLLDFNKAHSPPCAFTPYATCPVPPQENALQVRIEAGELNPHQK